MLCSTQLMKMEKKISIGESTPEVGAICLGFRSSPATEAAGHSGILIIGTIAVALVILKKLKQEIFMI